MVAPSVHPTPSMLTLANPAFASERVRLAAYTEARDFYNGVQWQGQGRRNESRYTFNYARLMIRKAASYCFPEPVTFDVPPSEERTADTPAVDADGKPKQRQVDPAAAAAETELTRVLGEIGADDLDFQLVVDAMISGDAAVKITWDDAEKLPIITPVDPAQLIVTTRPDRPKVPLSYAHYYLMTPEEFGAAMPKARIATDLIGSKSQLQVVEEWTPDRWRVTYAGQLVTDEANPYGWLPYLVLANNPSARSFWGASALVDLYDVFRELNRRISVAADVLQLAGWPITVLENVEGSEGIQVGPGAKWELPEDAKAYLLNLLENGGMQPHIDFITDLRRTMHDLAESPKTAFGDSGRDLSGAALEVEIQPLVQQVRRLRRMCDGYFRDRNRRFLDLMERFGGVSAIAGVRRAVAVWPDILPSDAEAEATRLQALTTSDNMSHRTAMGLWGAEDPEAEWLRLIEEKTAIVATEPQPEGDDDDDDGDKDDKPKPDPRGTTPGR